MATFPLHSLRQLIQNLFFFIYLFIYMVFMSDFLMLNALFLSYKANSQT